MRVIILILAIVSVLYAYAWQISRESRPYHTQPQSVYSNRGTTLDAEASPC